MRKYKIFYVILHYQAIKQTLDCVYSIKKLSTNFDLDIETNIVIVDNASPNKSGYEIKNIFKNDKNINVIISSENLGYAKGNNLGYKYAKDMNADFIVQMNNDMLIEDIFFNKKIISLYDKYKYGVMGPDIYCPHEDIHQNPAKGFGYKKTTIIKKIIRAYIIMFINEIGLYRFLKDRIGSTYTPNYNESMYLNDNSNTILHGSCLIFSPTYIDFFDGLNADTFMYYEENILSYNCANKNIKMYYSSELQVLHFRKVATTISTKNEKSKIRFFYRNSIKSLKVFLDIVNSYNK